MGLTFQKAPLVELIAELRWSPPILSQPQPPGGGAAVQPMPLSWFGSSALDEFYMRFGGEVYQGGFQRVERVIPPNFPTPPFSAVYRYRQGDGDQSSLFQTGPGLFSANAVPPYKSWDEFSPVVAMGIAALLKTRPEIERELPFFGVTLRYINGFTPEYFGGASPSEFISETLGFRVMPPDAVSELLAHGQRVTPSLQLHAPADGGLVVTISVGEGLINGVSGVVMDTQVATTGPIPPDANAVMGTFHSARKMIHGMFVKITQPLHRLMQPIEGER